MSARIITSKRHVYISINNGAETIPCENVSEAKEILNILNFQAAQEEVEIDPQNLGSKKFNW